MMVCLDGSYPYGSLSMSSFDLSAKVCLLKAFREISALFLSFCWRKVPHGAKKATEKSQWI